MSDSSSDGIPLAHHKSSYGWVILAVCTLTLVVTYGIMYSYSVFFKPLAYYFNWDRATVSAVYSVFLVLRGAASIATGWLADRYGPVKLMVFCGLMTGLGLVLTSQVSTLWQLYLTYALIEAIGMSGSFAIGSALTARWFTKNRGLALGVFSTGSGLGTLVIVPTAERLISAYDWSTAFVIFGIIAWLFILPTAFLLRLPPATAITYPNDDKGQPGTANGVKENNIQAQRKPDVTLRMAVRNKKLWIMLSIFFLFVYSLQTIMVHLVNYATDMGISPLVAATFISTIGAVSIAGRILMGTIADKIGSKNCILLCCLLLVISLTWLLFTSTIWSFYVFAILFGFTYGGEVPLIPMFIGQFFGTKAMAALVGLTLFVSNVGGAIGPWVGGVIFDLTASYQLAFIITALTGFGALMLGFVLKK